MSKSIFGTVQYSTKRTIINPIGDTPFSNTRMDDHVQTFRNIEQKYTRLVADKKYDEMSADIIEYSNLYDNISKMVLRSRDKNMQLLLTITKQGLMAAIHAFHLHASNVELQVKTVALQNRVHTILSDKNTNSVMDTMSDTMSLTKTVALAPLYSYYIVLFGVPDDGFDPVKINQIMEVLKQYNIDPFQ